MIERPWICHEANGDFAASCEDDLRRWLAHRCLSTEGGKDELVARIRADDRNPERTCKCVHCPRYNEVPCDDECDDPLSEASSVASKEGL